jgi:hypothetical protein
MNTFGFFIFSLVVTFSFALFYLDNLRLSKSTGLKYMQIFSFIGILLVYCFIIYDSILSSSTFNVGDANNKIGTEINNKVVEVNNSVNIQDKETGKSWGIAGAVVGGM